MNCEWGHSDCRFKDVKCDLCFSEDFHYVPKTVKKKPGLAHRQQKADKRMGSSFEFRNHQNNDALIKDAVSSMTLNSGACHIKGDEQINGVIEIMEELKTKVKKQMPGKQTFTIEKAWLTKLNREAKQANKEFWYLKFAFFESNEEEIYIIVEQDIIMSMVKTMIEDRKSIATERLKADIAEKRRQLVDTELIAARAEIELLQVQLKFKKHEEMEA